jgi:hypothetical protein
MISLPSARVPIFSLGSGPHIHGQLLFIVACGEGCLRLCFASSIENIQMALACIAGAVSRVREGIVS